jgi:hypothetical protein
MVLRTSGDLPRRLVASLQDPIHGIHVDHPVAPTIVCLSSRLKDGAGGNRVEGTSGGHVVDVKWARSRCGSALSRGIRSIRTGHFDRLET